MMIRISLILVLSAITLLLLADLSAWLGFQSLLLLFTQLGASLLLCAFALLITAGLMALVNKAIRTVSDFFSSPNRARRQILFIQTKADQINRLFHFKTQQLQYFRQQEIKQLLNKNNRQHLAALSSAIDKELKALRKNIPANTFEALQQESRSRRKQKDIESLIQLQHKISELV